MPPHEYYAELILTIIVYCVVAPFFIIFISAFWIAQTHIAVLFPIWSVIVTPLVYFQLHRDENPTYPKPLPRTIEDTQKETKWLNTMSMMQRLIAIRLLTVNVHDIHASDKHFLQQLALLPGDAPAHVCERQTICRRHLARIESGESRFSDSENPLGLWLIAFFQSTICLIYFRLLIGLLSLIGLADG